jgi:hypothetical protein
MYFPVIPDIPQMQRINLENSKASQEDLQDVAL